MSIGNISRFYAANKNKVSKVKAPIAGQYSIAGQSHAFFSKLEIYKSLIAILVYRIQTSKSIL